MGIRPRNLVTAPIKPGSKTGTIEFCEENLTLNAQFDSDLKLCETPGLALLLQPQNIIGKRVKVSL